MISSEYDLILSGGQILTLDQQMTVVPEGTICIDQGKIIFVGAGADVPLNWSFKKRINLSGKIIMPAFFNSHNHAAMSIFRGLGNDLSLNDWLNHFIWPAERRNIRPETVYLGTMISAMEMIRSGSSIFADMYFFEEDVARACEEIGIRVILGEGILDFPTPNKPSPAEAMNHTRILFDRYRNNPLVSVAVAAHAPYTCSPEIIRMAAELSEELDITANIHLAETQTEIQTMSERYGKSPTRYLYDLGFLSPRTVAHHGIYLDSDDMDLLRETHTSIATIPNSNMKLGSGICPVSELHNRGINICLGTDGPASNNNQSMVRELQQLARIQKVSHNDPTILTAREAIRMATINGAKAYRMDESLGSVELGKQADLIIINPDQPHWYPKYDAYTTIAYSMQSEDVESVMINGQLVMENRKFTQIDEEKFLSLIRKLRLKH
jgi:5-methylthioadenosine/S-adenosylhomocysteine deaminase